MSQQGKIRIELNFATALIFLAITTICAQVALAQWEHMTPENAKKLAAADAPTLLAFITILSLILCAYLIRLLFGKLLSALDKNTDANNRMAQLLAERPCIRNPQND